jgi:hypothetical protein
MRVLRINFRGFALFQRQSFSFGGGCFFVCMRGNTDLTGGRFNVYFLKVLLIDERVDTLSPKR